MPVDVPPEEEEEEEQLNYRALSDQSYLPFLSFFFFFTAWKSEGRANNNGEKSWTRSRDNKNLDDKDFFSLFAWRDGISLSPDEKKKRKKEKGTLRKFPIDNKFINERIDITISMANKSSDGYLFSFSRGIIRS